MTISPEDQRAARRRVLTGMLTQVGDDPVIGWKFELGKDFPDVPLSAWRELTDDHLIEVYTQAFGGHITYRMTPAGWLEGLRITQALESNEVVMRGQRLMAFLKGLSDKAQGPTDDQLLDWWYSIPPDTGLTPGWVFNAISSGLLQQLFPLHRINVYSDHRYPNQFFRVPPNFGRRLVEHD